MILAIASPWQILEKITWLDSKRANPMDVLVHFTSFPTKWS